MITSQRRLFATHRQRSTWARVVRGDGREHEVDIDVLKVGDVIAVREGEIIPADGVVTEGLAAVDEEALCGVVGAVDKSPGDAVYAASFVRDGRLMVRVEKLGWIRPPLLSPPTCLVRGSIICPRQRKQNASRTAMRSRRWRWRASTLPRPGRSVDSQAMIRPD